MDGTGGDGAYPSRDRLGRGGGLVAKASDDDGDVLRGHRGDQAGQLLDSDADGVPVPEPSQRVQHPLLKQHRVTLRGGLMERHRA